MSNLGGKILRALMWLPSKQPLKVHYFWAGLIRWTLRDVLHYRQAVIYTNLGRSFPDKSYNDIRAIADRYYAHMAEMIVEAIWFGGCRNYDRLERQRIVEIANPEVLQRAYDNSPSVMVFDSHCGNWELLGGIGSYNFTDRPCPVNVDSTKVVYKALSSKAWEYAMHENRRAPVPHYDGLVEASGLLRYMLSRRGEKNIYLVNNDQYPSRAACDVGTFLHQPTTGFVGSSEMAHRLGMSVLFMRMDNDRRGHYTISFEPLCDDASTMSPEAITRLYYDHLEAAITGCPYNWLWSHKRWKNIK